MPDFDLTAQGFRLSPFHKFSLNPVFLLYLIDASRTHPVFFVRNRRRTFFTFPREKTPAFPHGLRLTSRVTLLY